MRLVLLLLVAIPLSSSAQVLVDGTVSDARSGTPLGAATVQISGTYTGTVANPEGRFSVELQSFPATLVVRFVGFATREVRLEEAPSEPLRIALEPAPFQLQEVVVSSEDPAVAIMREVIRRKQERRARLDRFRAEAYNRFTVENDTGIVSMAEGLSEFLWDRELGSREVVKASRRTANLEFEEFFPAAMFVANLYDDNIDVAGHNLMGVTHPDALDRYDFRLESTTQQEGRDVFTISVRTWRRVASGFEGSITVADRDFAMLSVDLQPNDAFIFPPPIQFFDVTYSQQYLPFEDDQWLPADFRAAMDLKIGVRNLLDFPVFRIRQFARLSDYEVNVALPDSVFASDEVVTVDSAAVRSGDALNDPAVVVPLTAREAVALASIDSTQSIEEAFQPRGMLGRAAQINAGDENRAERRFGSLQFLPDIAYNRVVGASPALRISVGGAARAWGRVEHSFGLDQTLWSGGARLARRDWEVRVSMEERVRTTSGSWTRSSIENSLGFMLGARDYFDYYRSDRVQASLTVEPGRLLPDLTLGLRREDVSSVPKTTEYRLLDKDEEVADNPRVPTERVGSVFMQAVVGVPPDPAGFVTGSNSVQAEFEAAGDGLLGGETAFVRAGARATGRLPTFHRRRLLPQVLDIRLHVGWSREALPQYRLWSVDGAGFGSRPGSLRSLQGRPLEGDRSALVTWEHHFRTVPFERLGWRWAVDEGLGIIAFGGHGRTWLRPENQPRNTQPRLADRWQPNLVDAWVHELGLSISGLFGMLRVDLVRRLDDPAWSWGIGAARIF
ncbi:MAG: carboxypeptidase-like regulatory domain-containing protein [Rhodothermales bacterium]|nr:carboxypeptidase-like regulatory domain-containing protein [Rhodothermales bacterium]